MKRQISLVFLALVLGGAYVYFFTDLFKSARPIEIYATVRPSVTQMQRSHSRDRDKEKEKEPAAETYPVSFTFRQDYRINEIKVVSAEEFKTNKYAHPLWHMISDSSSRPMKGFTYGSKIAGMKPSLPRGKAEALQTDVTYLLLIDAGKNQGEISFKTKAVKQS
ncbi:MAG: hypothetical protein JWM68_2092 [Verrucomicrobiales bacterium]|nr:hypothetical protein [Verrucomicrobiales bacterium]